MICILLGNTKQCTCWSMQIIYNPLNWYMQGCPEAMAHDNIASYSAHFFVRSKKYSSISNKHGKNIKYWQLYPKLPQNEGIFSQSFLGEDPRPPFKVLYTFTHKTFDLHQLSCRLLPYLWTTLYMYKNATWRWQWALPVTAIISHSFWHVFAECSP